MILGTDYFKIPFKITFTVIVNLAESFEAIS